MKASNSIRLVTILIFGLTISSCYRIGMKCGSESEKADIEDAKSCLGAAVNALKFYYEDNKAYPDSFEVLETEEYLTIDQESRVKWDWNLTKSADGHILLSATSVKNSCCGKKRTVAFDYTTGEWVK